MTKNIIANFIGKFWGLLSGFLFIPLYIKFLGFESYSIISFTLVILGLMAVLDAGLTATLSREFARTDTFHDEKIRIFKTLESSYLIIIGVCIILTFALSDIIANKWLILKTFNPKEVSYFLKIISFDVGFQLLLRFYLGGFLGLEKQVTANLYQIGWGMVRNGFVVIAILIFPTLEVFFIWQTISTIIFVVLIRLSLNKILIGQYKLDFNFKIERAVYKDIWRFAGGMLLISFVASLNTQMDKLAISKLLAVEYLGYYTLAISLSIGILILVNPISIALLPRLTALYSSKRNEEASKLFYKANLYIAILVFALLANMTFFAKELIWIWTGKIDLAQKVYFLVPIIALAYAFLSLQIIPFNIAIANGNTNINNWLGSSSLFITLPGYWFATNYFGMIGTAYVFCGIQIITTFIYIYFINQKFIKIKKISKLYINHIFIPIVISLPIAYAFSFMPYVIEQNRAYALIWIGIATIATLTVSIILLVPFNDIKQFINMGLQRTKFLNKNI